MNTSLLLALSLSISTTACFAADCSKSDCAKMKAHKKISIAQKFSKKSESSDLLLDKEIDEASLLSAANLTLTE